MGKFWVANVNISGGETFWGVNVFKKVIGNLSYREMLFYKKALTILYTSYCATFHS